MAGQHRLVDYIAGNTIIRYTDVDPALLEVEAVVEEQDTNLLLGRSPVIRETVESLPSLLDKMKRQVREVPGEVLIKRSAPTRLIAIVYDIDQTPVCRTDWIETAITAILEHCQEQQVQSLAMPALGTSYGELRHETMMQILQSLLMTRRQTHPRHILIYHLD